MDRERAQKALIKLARQSGATWRSVRGEAFLGETTIETSNALYRFVDGVFAARASRPARGAAPAWESPAGMKGTELIGFLADEGGLWSLSPRWRPGAMAVVISRSDRFTLTSPTLGCTCVRPRRSLRAIPARSEGLAAPSSRPPTLRRPAPPSMTRLQRSARQG